MKNFLFKRISFGLLAVLPVVLAFITVVEKIWGREIALEGFYHSWWFASLWGILAASGLTYLIVKKRYRQKAAFLLHLSLIVILIGAFITFLTAERGYLHLRQGKPATTYTAEDEMTQKPLPFEIKLVLFEMEYNKETGQPTNYRSFLRINGDVCMVAMNRIYTKDHFRLYQLSYDSDEMGTILLVYRDPWGIGVTYAGYILLALSLLWVLWMRISWKGTLVLLVPTLAVWFYISQIQPMTPILRTPMLALHVSVILVAYVLLLLTAVFSAIGLASFPKRLRMYEWNNTILYPALALLVIGIFIGAVWANISWGRYWGWDSKETWALITMLVYAIPLHKESLPMFADPKKFHWYCLIAFLTVLMTFLGVSFLLSGMHSYMS
ncbi:MAG: cytochrome c assembly family protein [Bacteroidetes bacterium]|nr:cytochrome c assembly family protein [Bacteroidota bacterium]